MADNISRLLTDAKVRNVKPEAKPKKHKDGGGLYLLVQPNGTKLWRYKFRLHGNESTLAIGGYPDLSLADARAAHMAARTMVAKGQNPVHTRQADRRQAAQLAALAKHGAFMNVLQAWRDKTDPDLAPLTIRQRNREITKYLVPAFRQFTVDAIKRADLAALLRRIEAKAPEVTRNLRNYLNGIFEFAIDAGMVDANPVPPTSLLKRRNAVSHAAMDLDTLPAFLAKLRSCGANRETVIALELVILTACRKNEVVCGRWSEIDLDAGVWVVPAERMKARREHWVPLSPQAVALLRELRTLSDGEVLFPHRKDRRQPMADRTLNALIERIGYSGTTVHGFRSMFSTHFNSTGANPDVIERCLAHAPRDAVRAAYNRHSYHDERRAMMLEWSNLIDQLYNQANPSVWHVRPAQAGVQVAAVSRSENRNVAGNMLGA
jgi:integrase